jgi:zinc transporter
MARDTDGRRSRFQPDAQKNCGGVTHGVITLSSGGCKSQDMSEMTHAYTLDSSDFGLIWAYRFSPEGVAQSIPTESAIAEIGKDHGWLWLHLGLADTRCRTWLAERAPISEAARETLLDPDEHVRLDVFGGEVVGILPDFHQQFLQEGDDLVRLHLALSDRLLITARRKPVHSIDVMRRQMEAGKLFPSPIAFFDAIVDQFADTISRLSERHGDELDAVENKVLHDEIEDQRLHLGRVRLQSIQVRRQLTQVRSLFDRLEARMEDEVKPLAIAMRGLAQKLDALDHEIGSIYERARLLQEEIAARMAEITNRRLFTLSVLTALLLPSTLVTGFFGMNTKDMPFQASDGGTWVALVLVAAAGGITYWILKRIGAL